MNHNSLSTQSHLDGAQRFTTVLEPISLINRRLAGCCGRKTYWINRAPERINGLLYTAAVSHRAPPELCWSIINYKTCTSALSQKAMC